MFKKLSIISDIFAIVLKNIKYNIFLFIYLLLCFIKHKIKNIKLITIKNMYILIGVNNFII